MAFTAAPPDNNDSTAAASPALAAAHKAPFLLSSASATAPALSIARKTQRRTWRIWHSSRALTNTRVDCRCTTRRSGHIERRAEAISTTPGGQPACLVEL